MATSNETGVGSTELVVALFPLLQDGSFCEAKGSVGGGKGKGNAQRKFRRRRRTVPPLPPFKNFRQKNSQKMTAALFSPPVFPQRELFSSLQSFLLCVGDTVCLVPLCTTASSPRSHPPPLFF